MDKEPNNENELIETAREAVSESALIVGRCAALWTQKYAKGRTDADFGSAIGLTGDQIYSRRRVWETFADVITAYPNLKWSHFYAALNWDNAAECLQWAEENQATVAEMKAWRRLQAGEDLTVDADENCSESVAYGTREFPERSGNSVPVGGRQSPSADMPAHGECGPLMTPQTSATTRPAATVATIADAHTEKPYAPFKQGATTKPQPAATPRPEADAGDGAKKDAVLVRKTSNTVDFAIRHVDDARGLVTELLSTCWRFDQGETARAVADFYRANPLCKES